MSLCASFSRIGAMLAPYLAQVCNVTLLKCFPKHISISIMLYVYVWPLFGEMSFHQKESSKY